MYVEHPAAHVCRLGSNLPIPSRSLTCGLPIPREPKSQVLAFPEHFCLIEFVLTQFTEGRRTYLLSPVLIFVQKGNKKRKNIRCTPFTPMLQPSLSVCQTTRKGESPFFFLSGFPYCVKRNSPLVAPRHITREERIAIIRMGL